MKEENDAGHFVNLAVFRSLQVMEKGSSIQGNKEVAVWLFVGLVMLVIQVLLGGITRLKGAGLSITEWQPLLGAIPPLNESQWVEAFHKYQQIGQYKHMNSFFTLEDFKDIYFWEWFHRNWARLIGVVFIIPFLYFLFKETFSRKMKRSLLILFFLGALQGLIGWLMVKSGINPTDIYVNHIRLAIHFIAAMILLCYLLWFALSVIPGKENDKGSYTIRNFTVLLIVLVFIQLTYGAFMAGTHAALAAPTWPTINGFWIPALSHNSSLLESTTHNLYMIQFIHRGLAYLILFATLILFIQLRKCSPGSALYSVKSFPLIVVSLQVILGIFALLKVLQPGVIILNVLHQFVGMVFLLLLVYILFLSSRKVRQSV